MMKSKNAVFLEGSLEFHPDLISRAVFDLLAFEHVYQLAAAQDRD